MYVWLLLADPEGLLHLALMQQQVEMESKNFVKLAKDCKLLSKSYTTTDCDLIFTKVRYCENYYTTCWGPTALVKGPKRPPCHTDACPNCKSGRVVQHQSGAYERRSTGLQEQQCRQAARQQQHCRACGSSVHRSIFPCFELMLLLYHADLTGKS